MPGDLPQPQKQQRGKKENGQILVQAGEDGKPAEHAPGHQAHGHGRQPHHDALGKERLVGLGDHPHAHWDEEHNGAAENGGHHQAGVTAQHRVFRQIHGKLVASHVNGKQAAEHGRVHAYQPV